MKNALLLIPETNDPIDKQEYLTFCIKRVLKEGFMPLTPSVYESYAKIKPLDYVNSVIDIIKALFLFVDLGIDNVMVEVVRIVNDRIEVHFLRTDDFESFFNMPMKILMEVSRKTGIGLIELKTETRKKDIVDARYIYFRRAFEMTNATLQQIGDIVDKDHSTVIHGIKAATYNDFTLISKYKKLYGKS